jgi:hypothetical protein
MALRSRWTGWAALVVITILFLWAASGAVLCENALHVPRRRPSPISFGAPRPVQVKAADGVILRAWLLSPANDNGDCVIALHGIGDSRNGTTGIARLFIENGYKVLMPDSRGHGESDGEIGTYGLLEAEDVHRWVDWLIASEHPRDLYGMGESLGAAVLLQSLSVEKRFRAVIAECPFANFANVAEYRVAQRLPMDSRLAHAVAATMVWSGFLYTRLRYGVDFRAASAEAVAGSTSTPVLLIHGLDDTNIPPAHSRMIASRNQSIALWLVPGAGHTGAFQAAPEQFRQRVLGWFSEHSQLTGTTPLELQPQRKLDHPRPAAH